MEITCKKVDVLAIGFYDESFFKFKAQRLMGWDTGSIGYHSDDGTIIFGHSHEAFRYKKAYGVMPGTHTVGVGYNVLTHNMFYTLDGHAMKPIGLTWENIGCGITVSGHAVVNVNYGDDKFVFDLGREIDSYKGQKEVKK